jgi:ankyrin repeat protein
MVRPRTSPSRFVRVATLAVALGAASAANAAGQSGATANSAIAGKTLSAADASLIDAVKRGDTTAVRTLMRQRVNVNAADNTGTTVLHWAAQGGQIDVARQLLAKGASAKAANRYGVTPLQLAAINGDAAMARLLLTSGADVNATLPEGETVLMAAAKTGNADIVGMLLEAGARTEAAESWFGETALHWAAAENHPEAVAALAKGGAQVNVRSATQKFARRRNGQSIMSIGSWTPLMYAARQNGVAAGQALVKAGAKIDDVDPDGATALVIAIINAHYEFASMLIDAGADTNIVDNEAGMGALYAALDMHRLAVGHGRPNPRPVGAMTAVDVVRKLLEKKANPNAVLKGPIFQRQHTMGDGALGKGATPLMRASKSGDVAMMKLLLAAGADPMAKMDNGANALMLAAGLGWRFGSPAAPSFDQGTDAEAVEAIDILLGLGLSIDSANNQGDTVLHAAVSGRSSPIIVKHLLAKGASLTIKNKRNQNVLEAAKTGRKDVADLIAILEAAGAVADPNVLAAPPPGRGGPPGARPAPPASSAPPSTPSR